MPGTCAGPGRGAARRLRRTTGRLRRTIQRLRRLLALLVLVLLGFSGAGFRLACVQLIDHASLAEAAVLQRAQTVPLSPSRGRILDRRGEPLSDGRFTYRVAVYPGVVRTPAGDAAGQVAAACAPAGTGLDALAAALGVGRDALLDRLAVGGGLPVFVAAGLAPERAVRVMDLGLEGVAVVADEVRYGPRALARHAVGYVSGASGADGLEKAWDDYLGGRGPERLALFVDGRGQPLPGLGWRKLPAVGGGSPWTALPCDLVTTIDADVQRAVEEVLAAEVERGAAVVVDPADGDIMALDSRPQFDQGDVAGALKQDGGPLLDRVLAAYPPGSVLKPLVMAAALESRLVEPHERLTCVGEVSLEGRLVTCAARARGGHGELALEEALAVSCNVAFAEIGRRLGPQLASWAARFGLGRPTGVGLPGESGGVLPPDRSAATEPEAAFGQGSVMATPLQMALAYSAIANGGYLPAARLASGLRTPIGAGAFLSGRPGSAGESEPGIAGQGGPPAGHGGRRVISEFTAATVTAALCRAVEAGTGKAAAVVGSVAGKTGTAETGRVTPGGQELYDAWFAGFWPAYSPRLVIVVLMEDTTEGGGAAARVFGQILARILGLENG